MPSYASSSSSSRKSKRKKQRQKERRRRRHSDSSESSRSRSGSRSPRNRRQQQQHRQQQQKEVLIDRIGNEGERERRLADIEADTFHSAAFVSSRDQRREAPAAAGGSNSSRMWQMQQQMVGSTATDYGHSRAMFGKYSAANAAADNENNGQGEQKQMTEAARLRGILHPSLDKNLQLAWEQYRQRLMQMKLSAGAATVVT